MMARRHAGVWPLVGLLFVLAATAVIPFVTGPFWTSMVLQMLIFGLLALSVDLLLGHAGLFSLCHASFFAVAAYTAAILEVRHGHGTISASAAAIGASAVLAVVFGIAVRTRGVYFILITLALGYIVWGVAYRWSSFTGGDNGITNVPAPTIAGWQFASVDHYFYLALALIVIVTVAYWVLVSSPFGLALRGIKSSESRMRSLGYAAGVHLYAAFFLSGVFAGIAGVLYVHYNRFVNPVAASFPISVEAVLMAIIGGSGTILGPFLGAAVVLGLRNWVSSFFEYYNTVMGLVFIATVLWAPDGIIGFVRRLGARTASKEGRQ